MAQTHFGEEMIPVSSLSVEAAVAAVIKKQLLSKKVTVRSTPYARDKVVAEVGMLIGLGKASQRARKNELNAAYLKAWIAAGGSMKPPKSRRGRIESNTSTKKLAKKDSAIRTLRSEIAKTESHLGKLKRRLAKLEEPQETVKDYERPRVALPHQNYGDDT